MQFKIYPDRPRSNRYLKVLIFSTKEKLRRAEARLRQDFIAFPFNLRNEDAFCYCSKYSMHKESKNYVGYIALWRGVMNRVDLVAHQCSICAVHYVDQFADFDWEKMPLNEKQADRLAEVVGELLFYYRRELTRQVARKPADLLAE